MEREPSDGQRDRPSDPSGPDKKANDSSNDTNDRIASLQRSLGNQTLQSLLADGTLQAKLTVSHPDDEAEKEAERIAEQVLRMDRNGGGTGAKTDADEDRDEEAAREPDDAVEIDAEPGGIHAARSAAASAEKDDEEEESPEDPDGDQSADHDDVGEAEPSDGVGDAVDAGGVQRSPAAEGGGGPSAGPTLPPKQESGGSADGGTGVDAPTATESEAESDQDTDAETDTETTAGETAFGRGPRIPDADPPASPEDEDDDLQRQSTADVDRATDDGGQKADPERAVKSVQGGGRKIPKNKRSSFESKFGRDFSDVRVHTGKAADRAARSINAKAFTIGRDVAFRSGAYKPDSKSGRACRIVSTALLAYQ